jgi:voltage-gated potassium channel
MRASASAARRLARADEPVGVAFLRRLFARPVVRVLATLVLVLLIYYALPLKGVHGTGSIAFAVAGLLVGVVLLASLITRQVVTQVRAPEEEGVQVESLITLLFLVIAVFATGYLALSESDPNQFVSLETKTDSLYFTMSTLATVGFGDVHAQGQLARALVTLQIAFNLVFVGALVGLLTGRFRPVRRGFVRKAPGESGAPPKDPPSG